MNIDCSKQFSRPNEGYIRSRTCVILLQLVGGLVVYLSHRSCNSIRNTRTPCYSLYQGFLFLFSHFIFFIGKVKKSLHKALSDIKLGLEEKRGEDS